MCRPHSYSASILMWCLVSLTMFGSVLCQFVIANDRVEPMPLVIEDGGPEDPTASSDSSINPTSSNSLHRDLLKLYQRVLSELLGRDRIKRKVELLESRLNKMDDLSSRLQQLEETVRQIEMNTPHRDSPPADENSIPDKPTNHKGCPDTKSDVIFDMTPSGREQRMVDDPQRLDRVEPQPELDNTGNCQELLVGLNSKVGRYEHFLQRVAATLQDHTQQVEELQSCNTMHGDLIDGHTNRLNTIDTELAIHKAKVEKVKIGNNWIEFKVETLENSTRPLTNKVRKLDKAIDGIYTDHGNIYRKLDSMEMNASMCASCGIKIESQEYDHQSTIQQATGTLKTQSTPRPSTFGVNHHTYKAVVQLNATQREVLDNLASLRHTTKSLSLGVSSNRADFNKVDGQLEILFYQVDKLRESDEKTTKQQRRIQKKIRELQQEVNSPGIHQPVEKIRAANIVGDQALSGFTNHQVPSAREQLDWERQDPVVSATSRGSGLKREVNKFYITPPPHLPTVEGHYEGHFDGTGHSVDNSFLSMTAVKPGDDRKGDTMGPRVVVNNNAFHKCRLQSVGVPITVHQVPKTVSGWWSKDTWPGNTDSIYMFFDTYKASQLYEYSNVAALRNNTPSEVHSLPFSCSGSGHVIHHRNLFCNRFSTNRIMKYNLLTKQTKSRRILDAGYRNHYPYSFGGFSDIDLAVDELGMWVVYGSRDYKGTITIAKLNPDTLRLEQQWQTPFRKNSTGNTFMVCGKMYTVEYQQDHATVVNMYETATGISSKLPLSGLELGGEQGAYKAMLDYNPRDSKLYGWHMSRDWNGLLVTYDLVKIH